MAFGAPILRLSATLIASSRTPPSRRGSTGYPMDSLGHAQVLNPYGRVTAGPASVTETLPAGVRLLLLSAASDRWLPSPRCCTAANNGPSPPKTSDPTIRLDLPFFLRLPGTSSSPTMRATSPLKTLRGLPISRRTGPSSPLCERAATADFTKGGI